MVTAIEERTKRVARTKKAEISTGSPTVIKAASPSLTDKTLDCVITQLVELVAKAEQAKAEIAFLQKTVAETKENWEKEEENHVRETAAQDVEEKLQRKREKEEYEYQEKMSRKKAEDEFAEKKATWERELLQKKEQIEVERKELLQLRAIAAGFEAEKIKAVKDAQTVLAKEIEERYGTERRLREQEIKGEKDIFNLRITSLTAENSRQAGEIETLKKAYDEATKQVKEIAVKVIEGHAAKIAPTTE